MGAPNGKTVLVAGAGFAGLSSAYWMSELGYDVTVVEAAPGIRTGGTAVNVRGATVDVVKRMGIFDAIRANRLSLKRWDFKTADDRTVRSLALRADGEAPPDDDYEIERDVLMRILLGAVRGRCEIRFGDRVVGLRETSGGNADRGGTDRVDVAFQTATGRAFDLVLGCDGTHSGVRRLWFGEGSRYVHYLQQYFAITIADTLLIERDTAQLYNEPGKAVMLNAYRGRDSQDRTDIILCFVSDQEIPYDYRDEARQRKMVAEQFAGVGWRTAELLREVASAKSFYFDKLCQIRMPAWSKGRVVLVGDSAYCPSPAAGLGGSLAIDGAAALGDAMRSAAGEYAPAFRHYEDTLRPYVEEVQADAVRVGLETLVPRTEAAIRERNARTDAEF